MKAILELQQLGYTFTLDGDSIRYRHRGQPPDPQQVRPLLEYLQRHRAEALCFLRQQPTAGPSTVAVSPRLTTSPACAEVDRPWVGQRIKLEDLVLAT